MNSAEIYALYAPLWELVPETKPKRVRYGGRACFEDYFFWSDCDYERFETANIPDDAALALCRSAVLEWLMEADNAVLKIWKCPGPHSPHPWEIRVDHDGRDGMCNLDSLDHALVAVAMKVADKVPT